MSTFEGEALEVLRSIRDEVRSTNVRLDQTNDRLEQTRQELSAGIAATNERLDQTNTRLEQTNARLDQTNVRIEHMREELSAGIATTNERLGAVEGGLLLLSEQQRFIVRGFKAFVRRDRRFDRDIQELRTRMGRVEHELGLDEPDRPR